MNFSCLSKNSDANVCKKCAFFKILDKVMKLPNDIQTNLFCIKKGCVLTTENLKACELFIKDEKK